jgi:hypothetical protein
MEVWAKATLENDNAITTNLTASFTSPPHSHHVNSKTDPWDCHLPRISNQSSLG